MRRFFVRIINLLHGRRAEAEMSREMEAHLALLQEDFERSGLSTDEAMRAARRAFRGVEQVKELHRDERSFVWLEQRWNDLRFGARTLRQTPGFTAIAVLTLALGIGANTAIFSVVNAVLLRPLGYQDADRLVTVLHYGNGPVAAGNYVDWRDQSHSFEAMTAAEYWSSNLTGTDVPEHLIGLRLTQQLLPMLGVRPMIGRLFAVGEDQVGADHEVLLSYRLWQRRFNGDRRYVGKQIELNGEGYTVIGVMPPAFQFAPFWATRAELWVPLALGDRIHANGGSLRVFARLRPGVSLGSARAEMRTITTRLEHQFPGTNRDIVVTPLKENVVGKIQTPLLLVLGAVGFVLLIACANVAHMLLARTSDRQKEIAVRTALGAGRARVMGQFLTENLLLGLAGALAGLILAWGGTKALVALSPAYLPRVETVGIDSHALLFLLGITLATAAVFGLAPAMHAAVGNVSSALKEGGRGDSEGKQRNRLRGFLVASEFALAFMLLIGAGLMMRSFVALQLVDPGFDPHHILSLVVSVAGTKEADPGRRGLFYRELLERMRTIPGVASVGATNHLPLGGDLWGYSFLIEGRPKPRPGEAPGSVYRMALPGYFETMRIPILRGRSIREDDDARAREVVVINEEAAREYWPGEDPIGKRITFDDNAGPASEWITIVGVSANAKQGDWASKPGPETYLPAYQNTQFMEGRELHFKYITLVLRTERAPASVVSAVKKTVWAFDRNLPISEVLTMDEVVAAATAQPRFEMLLLAMFAAVALVLAAVGIYGVMNYAVVRRTREIGIRMALGASRGEVLRMVVSQGMRQAVAGTVVGIAGALVCSRMMASMLYGVKPTDPVTFGAVVVVLGAVAMLATCVPGRKAVRIEPMTALRTE